MLRWTDKLEKITLNIIIVLGTVMLIVAWGHIFYRYALNDSLKWSEEFLKICLVWFSMLSASLISKRSEHIGITVFRMKMPERVQRALIRFVRVLMLIACMVVTVVGMTLVLKSTAQFTPALSIPYSLSYAAIPVSFLLMFIYELTHILNKNYEDPSNLELAAKESNDQPQSGMKMGS